MAHKAQGPPMAGLVVCGFGYCLLMRSQYRVEHLGDGALLGFRQAIDLFELLLQLRRWSAFGGTALGLVTNQFFDADAEVFGELHLRKPGSENNF
jgi:hypothetical protein